MFELSLEQAVTWMERLIAFAVVLQTIELLKVRSSFGPSGIWSWKVLSREFEGLSRPVAYLIDRALSDGGFPLLLWLRLLAGLLALVFSHPLIWLILLLSTVLIALRWRGTFNGGSDYMTLIVLLSILGASTFGESDSRWVMVAVGYVAFQTALSYFVAGVAKVRSPGWRNGVALTGFLNSDYYATPLWARHLAGSRLLMWIGGWGLLVFECLFPLSLLDPRVCLGFIGAAIAFQVMNGLVFGLNRFIWAWGAAYPALFWSSTHLATFLKP